MMRRSGYGVVAMLVASLLALCNLTVAQDEWQPTPLPLSDSPEVQPSRALLDQTVSVTLTGTVAEVVRALAESAGRLHRPISHDLPRLGLGAARAHWSHFRSCEHRGRS